MEKRRRYRLQSSMEYLMTYGWAILVIAVIIAVLVGVGVFGANQNTPNVCVSKTEFTCSNLRYTNNGISLSIGQDSGENFYYTYAFVTSSSEDIGSSGLPVNFSTSSTANMVYLGTLTPGQLAQLTYTNASAGDIAVSNVPVGTQFNGYVWLAYCLSSTCSAPTNYVRAGTLSAQESGVGSFSGEGSTTTSTSTSTTTTSTSTTSSTSTSTSTTTSTTSTILQCFNMASGTCGGDLFYTTSMSLAGNVLAANSIFVQGVTLVTNGWYMVANTVFQNTGTIETGNPNNQGIDCCTNPTGYPNSYGGSGGGGTGLGGAANGGTTLAPGGSNAGCCGGTGGNGGTPSASGITDSFIANTMVSGGFINYLTGGGGGWGYACCGGGNGGDGAYGIYIQGNTVINSGIIEANGTYGSGNSGAGEAGGGGGGGAILIAYGSGAAPGGSYTFGGGLGGPSCCGWHGGTGGFGNVIMHQYTNPPIAPPSPT